MGTTFLDLFRKLLKQGTWSCMILYAASPLSNVDELIEREILCNFQAPSDFILRMMKYVLQVDKAKEALHEVEFTDMYSRLNMVTENAENAQQTAKTVKKNAESFRTYITKFYKDISGTQFYRNQSYDQTFTGRIKTGETEWNPIYTLRCSKCKCKH